MRDNPKYKLHNPGRYTYGAPEILGWGEGAKLKIGSFTSIASGVVIMLGGNHRPDWVTTYPFNVMEQEFKHIEGHPATKGDVTIGSDVWIANNVTILSGVTIGDGAVIGANAVVARSVEPYSIVVGNPGKVIRKRFEEETIERLLEIKWWDWELEKIKENVPLMLTDDVTAFVEKHAPRHDQG